MLSLSKLNNNLANRIVRCLYQTYGITDLRNGQVFLDEPYLKIRYKLKHRYSLEDFEVVIIRQAMLIADDGKHHYKWSEFVRDESGTRIFWTLGT